MKLVSQGAQYAISAIIALSKLQNTVISAAELSRQLRCPAAYLSQILSKLKSPGILGSQRGLNGGVYLARSLDAITVYDVITAIDSDEFFSTCFMGINGCGHIEPCPFHNFWSVEREKIKKWLQSTTFSDTDRMMSNKWFNERLYFNNSVLLNGAESVPKPET